MEAFGYVVVTGRAATGRAQKVQHSFLDRVPSRPDGIDGFDEATATCSDLQMKQISCKETCGLG